MSQARTLGGSVQAGRPGRRAVRRRRILLTLLSLLALAAVATVLVVVVALGLRGPLEDGRAALEEGRSALLDGRADEAATSFAAAESSFRDAQRQAGSALGSIARSMPLVGRTVRVMSAIADAGDRVAGAGSELSNAIQELPGGVDALTPIDGVIPIQTYASLGPAVADAHADVAAASAILRSSPEGFVPDPVVDARRTAIARVDELEHLLRSARAAALVLPEIAGADGPKRYLFFAEDPAELRGTGGIWGAYATVEANAGRLVFSRFRPTQSLGVPDDVRPPSAEYLENYGQYGAPAYWLSANMTPHFPTAAQAALADWEALGKPPLDGVITADPFALRELLHVTGRIRVERPPIELTSEGVVSLLANRGFALFPDPQQRKALLGEAARAVLDRFLAIDGKAVPRVRALGRAFADGHLKIFVTDPAVQSALAGAEADAGLPAAGDLMAVIVNQGAGGKIDFFATRSVRHDVTLLPGGAATAITVVTIENAAPTSGQPRYVIGPHRGKAGDDIPLLAVYCGRTCELVLARRDDQRIRVRTGTELGYRFYRDYFTIPAGEERSLSIQTQSRAAWVEDGDAGSYRLTVVGQTTIRPTRADIEIRVPAGFRVTSSTDGVEIEGERAVWRGVLSDRLVIDLSVERAPLVTRLWRALFD